MTITVHHVEEKRNLPVHVPRIVNDQQMEVARENLSARDFDLLNQLIRRIGEAREMKAKGKEPFQDYSELRHTETIRRMVSRAEFMADIRAIQEDPDAAIKELLKV